MPFGRPAKDRREVEDDPVIVPVVELVPRGLRPVSVQVVPHDVHPPVGVGVRDLLHEAHKISLRAPI